MQSLLNPKLEVVLSSGGFSLTKPRVLLFESLLDSEPLSVSEIIKLINGKVDRASIYRSLKLFEKLGIVHRVNLGFKFKFELSDKFREHHHHLICSRCGRIDKINEQSIEDFIDKIARSNNFKTQSHQLEIHGLCSKCQ